MGTIIHKAVIVTYNSSMDKFEKEARSLGLTVLGPSEEVINQYKTMVVCPHGSKEGWPDCNRINKLRQQFVEWLKTQGVEWVEVEFGWDKDAENTTRKGQDDG